MWGGGLLTFLDLNLLHIAGGVSDPILTSALSNGEDGGGVFFR